MTGPKPLDVLVTGFDSSAATSRVSLRRVDREATLFDCEATLVQEDRIPLAAAIQGLRDQLLEAMRAGSAAEIRFGVGGVEMEFEVQATRSADAEAGVKFWVVNAGAKGTVGSGTTQRIKLTLVPVTAAGEDLKVTSFVTGDIG